MFYQLRIIPLLPLLGAAYLILFGRHHSRRAVHRIACLAVGAAFLVAADAFFFWFPILVQSNGVTDLVGTWFASGDLQVDLVLRMDALSGLMCLVVSFVGTLIHIYSTGYMAHDEDYARFFAYLNLFCGAMLLLVLGDSLPVMFIGWRAWVCVATCSSVSGTARRPMPARARRRSSPTEWATWVSSSAWFCSSALPARSTFRLCWTRPAQAARA